MLVQCELVLDLSLLCFLLLRLLRPVLLLRFGLQLLLANSVVHGIWLRHALPQVLRREEHVPHVLLPERGLDLNGHLLVHRVHGGVVGPVAADKELLGRLQHRLGCQRLHQHVPCQLLG